MATPPPGASLRWVGRGRCRRICLDSLNRIRKKLFIDGIHFILFFNNPSSIVSNTITFFIPPALSAGRTSFRVPLPSRPRVFGWLLRVFASFIGRLRPQRIFFSYFFSINSMAEPTPRHSPARSAQAAPLLHRPLHRFRLLSFDCCVT